MRATMRIVSATLVGLALTACSPIIRNHGYAPAEDQLAAIEVGRASRDDVAEAVGQPTASGVLGEESWYYVQSRFRHYGYRAPVEIDREVVAISFAPEGTVRNIERFGLEQGRVVPISRRVTDDNTQGIGFLRQLFRNVGNINPGSIFGD